MVFLFSMEFSFSVVLTDGQRPEWKDLSPQACFPVTSSRQTGGLLTGTDSSAPVLRTFAQNDTSAQNDTFARNDTGSDDKEGVAVRAELVAFLQGGIVCLHDILVSSESGH